jgi:hypothetical protein
VKTYDFHHIVCRDQKMQTFQAVKKKTFLLASNTILKLKIFLKKENVAIQTRKTGDY